MPAKSRNPKGRPKGSPNKATQAAREAIGLFVDRNSHRLQGWLDAIAGGVKQIDPESGEESYVIKPDPQTAFELFQSVIEYHVPKLQRTDVNATVDAKLRQSLKIEFVNGQVKNQQ